MAVSVGKNTITGQFGRCDYLGGGFKYCLFLPILGEDFQFDLYFSKGLKPPICQTYIGPFKFYKYVMFNVVDPPSGNLR